MKRITTKELLASSFLELSEKKPINKITIANIVENCELTQPTFYRYFKDKYDMMIWIYVKEIGKSFEKIGTDKHEWKDTIIDGVVYFIENKKFLINALKHTSGRDSFLWQMSKMNIEFMENEIKKEMHTKECPKDLSILICKMKMKMQTGWKNILNSLNLLENRIGLCISFNQAQFRITGYSD